MIFLLLSGFFVVEVAQVQGVFRIHSTLLLGVVEVVMQVSNDEYF